MQLIHTDTHIQTRTFCDRILRLRRGGPFAAMNTYSPPFSISSPFQWLYAYQQLISIQCSKYKCCKKILMPFQFIVSIVALTGTPGLQKEGVAIVPEVHASRRQPVDRRHVAYEAAHSIQPGFVQCILYLTKAKMDRKICTPACDTLGSWLPSWQRSYY